MIQDLDLGVVYKIEHQISLIEFLSRINFNKIDLNDASQVLNINYEIFSFGQISKFYNYYYYFFFNKKVDYDDEN